MYLNAERIAIANQAIIETFENTCIAWQAIPHWDTCDPGQSRVRNDVVDKPGFLRIQSRHVTFQVTLVQTCAPTADSLLAEVNWAATELAQRVDDQVLRTLRKKVLSSAQLTFKATSTQKLLNNLINARTKVENAGYRAPSCLITNTKGLKDLNDLTAGYPITDALLAGAHVNSLHRASQLDRRMRAWKEQGGGYAKKRRPGTVMVLLGRRQRIAHAGAPDAMPGEEPVDLAISVPPSLEVVGETTNSRLELSVRVRFALRVKDRTGLAALYGSPVVPKPPSP